ncbi:pyridoxamine 5'-phosphate oxidase family protein [Culicoidibacter larvae]|uniref:FMN-binding protein n=1 Tax=Culicoidibacter larvae TaxID=2579976 RepID=A0A5R8QDR6_9FIRM|nr:FMN-binding protein [Culicoidibacter larvae]TLG75397.1 FMN-binding protein [Culicoidibacter larvae]
MLTEKFLEVLKHEGVFSIVTCADNVAHIDNTWNSYIRITEDGKLLIPAAGMHTTETNMAANNLIKMTTGTKEVQGNHGPGAGHYLEGTGELIFDGPIYDATFAEFPFIRAVLVITPTFIKQTV